jgi:hypothetical protein
VRRFIFTSSQTETCVYDSRASANCSTSSEIPYRTDIAGRTNSIEPCFEEPPKLLPSVGRISIDVSGREALVAQVGGQ